MRRKGFTLVELIVVMSIIAVLASLTIAVVGRFITAARESATETTIRKVNALLADRAESLYRLTSRSGLVESTTEFQQAAVLTMRPGPGQAPDGNVRKIIARKLLLRKYFPQQWQELDATIYPQAVSGMSNGEVLYHFVQNTALGNPEGLDQFNTSEMRDTNTNGFPEFLDGWGRPLRFYRWPTRLFRPTGAWQTATTVGPIDATGARLLFSTLPSFSGDPQADLSRDPDDPLRQCLTKYSQFNPPATYGPFAVAFENLALPTGPCNFGTPATYWCMLVVSAGQDGVLGLYEPDDTANFGHLGAVRDLDALADDITFLNVRAGGR